MAINFTNGSVYKPPRVVTAFDTRSGCPGTMSSNSVITSASLTVANTSTYWMHGRVIFRPASAGKSRCDFYLQLNSTIVKYALDTTVNTSGNPAGWDELDATYMGTIGSGTHTFYMVAYNASNCWGCGSTWGELNVMLWEAS